jgi:putative inorganic carbon (HCO3(-)) transporter
LPAKSPGTGDPAGPDVQERASLPSRIWNGCRRHPDAVLFYILALSNLSILFSIAISQTLLGLGLAVLLFNRRKVEVPRLFVPIACFAVWTLVSLALSQDPVAGLPQIKKFYIFFIVIAAYTAFRDLPQVDRIARGLFVASSVAGVVAVAEFGLYYSGLHSQHDFYTIYSLGSRITGFMGHWQTFSGQQMLVLVVLLAFLLFSSRRPWWTWTAAGIISLSLLLSFTRGVWLGCLGGGLYLLWQFRRPLVLAVPLALLLLYLFSPGLVRERIRSLVDTRADSSNQARLLMTRTGLNMIRQHPLVGIGPNGVNYSFDRYRPRPAETKPSGYYGHLHNNYLQIAAERGLPCLAFFVWLLVAAAIEQRRLAGRLPPEFRYIAHGVVAAVIAIAIAGAFEYNFGDSEVAMLFLFFLTHGSVAQRSLQPAGRATASAR